MSDIAYPRPENLRGRFGRWVTADVFHIAERLQEIDKNLFIQHLDPPSQMGDEEPRNFAVIEYVPHGHPPEQLVTRTVSLDSRLIEHIQMLQRVPFKDRFEAAERLADKREQEYQQQLLDEALENWGYDFRRQLAHDGFITHTGTSYPSRAIHPTREARLWQPGT